jgi:hypothetical protein
MGDRWSLVLLRDVMFGNRHYFRELLAGVAGGNRFQHPRRSATAAGRQRAALPSVTGTDYMVEHWLASYAILVYFAAMTARVDC